MINRVFKKIGQKSRIEEYASIIRLAIENDYKVVSLKDWYHHHRNSTEKVFILRHDVDYDTKGAYTFYQIEKKLGATSTFYFRWCTMNDRVMREMHNNGFEVSLHFETLATYSKENKLYNKTEITDEVIAICQKRLSQEIDLFEQKYWEIDTICSHGDKRNRVLGITNHVLWNSALQDKHQVLFETYDESITSLFQAYISDSSIYNDFKWQHFGSPLDAIKQEKRVICLLTHPIHWNQSLIRNLRMLWKIYFDNRN